MKIGLDFDGVISNCGLLKQKTALKYFNINVPAEKFKKEFVLNNKLLTPDQYHDLQSLIYENWEVGYHMRPVRGALKYISKLILEKYEIIVITSRQGKSLEIAERWSKQFDLNLIFKGVGYGVSKAESADSCTVFVDDDIDKLEQLVEIVPYRYLFSWGYNQFANTRFITDRAHSWADLYRKIKQINS